MKQSERANLTWLCKQALSTKITKVNSTCSVTVLFHHYPPALSLLSALSSFPCPVITPAPSWPLLCHHSPLCHHPLLCHHSCYVITHCSVITPALSSSHCSVITPSFCHYTLALSSSHCSVITPSFWHYTLALSSSHCSVITPSFCHYTLALSSSHCSVITPSFWHYTLALSSSHCSVITPSFCHYTLALSSSHCSVITPSFCHYTLALSSPHCSVITPSFCHYTLALSSSHCSVITPSFCHYTLALSSSHCSVITPSFCHYTLALSSSHCSVITPSFWSSHHYTLAIIPLLYHHPLILALYPCSVIVPLLCHHPLAGLWYLERKKNPVQVHNCFTGVLNAVFVKKHFPTTLTWNRKPCHSCGSDAFAQQRRSEHYRQDKTPPPRLSSSGQQPHALAGPSPSSWRCDRGHLQRTLSCDPCGGKGTCGSQFEKALLKGNWLIHGSYCPVNC